MEKYILALDQGTTSSRAILFNSNSQVLGLRSKEFSQVYPQPGWVEQRPEEILESQVEVARQVLIDYGVEPSQIAAIGLTNQRETTVLWERSSGKPVHNAIVWQCRRSASICGQLKTMGYEGRIREKTGLVPDPYFSATKLKWLLDSIPGTRQRAKAGELLFGTIDTWLLWKLSGGKVHATDFSNASRTMLYNINNLEWDQDILNWLDIPEQLLPQVCPSSHDFCRTDPCFFGEKIPLTGVIGDQQAALFGQGCYDPGMAKNTYGTGGFLLMNTGERKVASQHGLLTTIAWGLDGKINYALEGSIFIAGAAIQWLRDQMGLLESAAQSEELALSINDTQGVYLIPAFVGLGAPYWDPYARGIIVGLTRGTTREHVVRAALEAIAYQTKDVLTAMVRDSGNRLAALRVDGGASLNNFLLQFQSDILSVKVQRPTVSETTALGAAYMAGLAVGFWRNLGEICSKWQIEKTFYPSMSEQEQTKKYTGWLRAVERSKDWLRVEE